MASVLDDLLNFEQLQQASTTSAASLSSSALLVGANPPANNGNELPPTSDGNGDDDNDDNDDNDNDNEGDMQPPPSTHDSSDTVAAFTVSTARNLRLTTDGERSLLQFSQVSFFVALSHFFLSTQTTR